MSPIKTQVTYSGHTIKRATTCYEAGSIELTRYSGAAASQSDHVQDNRRKYNMNRNNRNKKKLVLSRETIKTLSAKELNHVQGGRPPVLTGYTVCFSADPRTDCCLSSEATAC